MDFLPKNKWLALVVFVLIVALAVVVATSVLKLKPDPKNIGSYRFSLGGKKQSAAGTK